MVVAEEPAMVVMAEEPAMVVVGPAVAAVVVLLLLASVGLLTTVLVQLQPIKKIDSVVRVKRRMVKRTYSMTPLRMEAGRKVDNKL